MDRLAAALAAAGLPARPGGALLNAEHTFSHIHWHLRVFRFDAEMPMEAAGRGAGPAAVAETAAAYDAAGGAGSAAQPQALDAGAAADDTAAEYRWITREDMDNLAFPNVFLRILNRYFGA
jgi:A/G-specific adenine glycosylase